MLFLASSALGVLIHRAFGMCASGWRAALDWLLLFPFFLHLDARPLLRQPGYDDIQMGACRIPACDGWSLAVVAAVSAAFYLLVAHVLLVVLRRHGRSRGA